MGKRSTKRKKREDADATTFSNSEIERILYNKDRATILTINKARFRQYVENAEDDTKRAKRIENILHSRQRYAILAVEKEQFLQYLKNAGTDIVEQIECFLISRSIYAISTLTQSQIQQYLSRAGDNFKLLAGRIKRIFRAQTTHAISAITPEQMFRYVENASSFAERARRERQKVQWEGSCIKRERIERKASEASEPEKEMESEDERGLGDRHKRRRTDVEPEPRSAPAVEQNARSVSTFFDPLYSQEGEDGDKPREDYSWIRELPDLDISMIDGISPPKQSATCVADNKEDETIKVSFMKMIKQEKLWMIY